MIPGKGRQSSSRKVAEPKIADYADQEMDLSPQALAKNIKALEQQMHKCAKDLEFEEAARIRDELTALKHRAFVGA